MGIDPYEKIDPAVIPTDSRIAALIKRHNSAVKAAKKMERMRADWTDGRLPSLSLDDVSDSQGDIAREWEIAAETAADLDSLGYDPDDFSWGR